VATAAHGAWQPRRTVRGSPAPGAQPQRGIKTTEAKIFWKNPSNGLETFRRQ
jgi:hypothetical protein